MMVPGLLTRQTTRGRIYKHWRRTVKRDSIVSRSVARFFNLQIMATNKPNTVQAGPGEAMALVLARLEDFFDQVENIRDAQESMAQSALTANAIRALALNRDGARPHWTINDDGVLCLDNIPCGPQLFRDEEPAEEPSPETKPE